MLRNSKGIFYKKESKLKSWVLITEKYYSDIYIYSVFIPIGNPKGRMILNDKEGEKMTKKKNKQLNNNKNALPKVDEEFAEESGNGLEKVALKAQKRQQNK